VELCKPAQYLLRFDDLCPTVGRARWQRLAQLVEELGIRPILAVVPDNQDPGLLRSDADPEFWGRMRAMQAAGATIGLHGYRHLCQSRGKSLLPLHRMTEFAGVPEGIQSLWIEKGMEILRAEGLDPRIWVAPRHGFDRTTLRVLRRCGLHVLSDGLARTPFLSGGVIWIPQQLWEPVPKSHGLWTVCIHANTIRESQISELAGFVRSHAVQFTSVDRVLEGYQQEKLAGAERFYAAFALGRAQLSIIRKRWMGGRD
jgi:hypothetical protein